MCTCLRFPTLAFSGLPRAIFEPSALFNFSQKLPEAPRTLFLPLICFLSCVITRWQQTPPVDSDAQICVCTLGIFLCVPVRQQVRGCLSFLVVWKLYGRHAHPHRACQCSNRSLSKEHLCQGRHLATHSMHCQCGGERVFYIQYLYHVSYTLFYRKGEVVNRLTYLDYAHRSSALIDEQRSLELSFIEVDFSFVACRNLTMSVLYSVSLKFAPRLNWIISLLSVSSKQIH